MINELKTRNQKREKDYTFSSSPICGFQFLVDFKISQKREKKTTQNMRPDCDSDGKMHDYEFMLLAVTN